MSTPHHRLAPSAAHRWMTCPGSVVACAELTDVTSGYAAEGTAAHQIAAEVLLGRRADAQTAIGEVLSIDGHEIHVGPEMADAVDAYVQRVYDLPRGFQLVETRLDLNRWIPGGFGHADHILVAGRTCYVTDLKYGKGVQVEADANPQLMIYGLGALDAVDHLAEVDYVVLRVDQPRLDHLSEVSIPVEDLRKWGEYRLRPAVDATRAADAARVPGESQCRWCLAKATCPAVRDLVVDSMQDFPILGGDVDDEALPDALALAKLAQDWAKAVEAYAYDLLSTGHAVDGFKLVKGRSSRSWADEAAAEKKLRRLRKVDEVAPRKLVSPAQAQKLLGKKDWVKVEDLVAVKPGKPNIAPASDKRPAVNPAEACGFEAIPESDERKVA